jgi:hypothetical protein
MPFKNNWSVLLVVFFSLLKNLMLTHSSVFIASIFLKHSKNTSCKAIRIKWAWWNVTWHTYRWRFKINNHAFCLWVVELVSALCMQLYYLTATLIKILQFLKRYYSHLLTEVWFLMNSVCDSFENPWSQKHALIQHPNPHILLHDLCWYQFVQSRTDDAKSPGVDSPNKIKLY